MNDAARTTTATATAATASSGGAATVTVLFFAQLRAAAGTPSITVPLAAGATVASLARELQRDHPDLSLRGSLCAVNEDYADPQRQLNDGETVAFLPPISGG